ncbi:hypothetical protein J6590_079915 [Homalodisca vitripennis]|nr:hypothetical protein J6590_079915 [Homalodisca vitripennis]
MLVSLDGVVTSIGNVVVIPVSEVSSPLGVMESLVIKEVVLDEVPAFFSTAESAVGDVATSISAEGVSVDISLSFRTAASTDGILVVSVSAATAPVEEAETSSGKVLVLSSCLTESFDDRSYSVEVKLFIMAGAALRDLILVQQPLVQILCLPKSYLPVNHAVHQCVAHSFYWKHVQFISTRRHTVKPLQAVNEAQYRVLNSLNALGVLP